jgi:predicted nucleotidyltransferase
MPVRSLRSSVLKWPDAAAVDRAVRQWARRLASGRPDVLRIAYFGSYARGDWGVGSDLDLLILVESSQKPFLDRPLDFDLSSLPVPAEVLVYTESEWDALPAQSPRFYATLLRDSIPIFTRLEAKKGR